MKTTLHLLLLISFALAGTTALQAQAISAGRAGKFGVDGDISSDVALSGIQPNQQAGTHDWFKKPGGAGIGLFDTTGAAAIKNRIINGENIAFSRSMQYPRYSIQDGDILMDASYTRDHIGLIGSTAFDKTTFLSSGQYSAQLGGDPTKWKTVPAGNQLPSKTDIVDTYVNMRRNGTTVSGGNPSHIMLHIGASTLANEGSRYMSFIFLKDRMNYDTATGVFTNSGPAATGGHSSWTFNADSSVKTTGDVAIAFNFGASGVESIELLVWCSYGDYTKMDPNKFQFVQGQWYGLNPKGGWGWAGIVRDNGSPLQAWGATNGAQTGGPAWGTSSKELGNVTNKYAATAYGAYQFAEASIDLTSAGLDFAMSSEDACKPPFTRYLVATRSSSGFTSPLMDFIGPYEFLDAPTASAEIIEPGNFNCTSGNSLTIAAANVIKGASYTWQTTNGTISQTAGDGSFIRVSKPGTYTLTAAIMQGCTSTQDTVVIGADHYKPVAKATNSGIAIIGAAATLFGGDAVASNYMTPYGGSKGLAYRWTKQDAGVVLSTWETASTTMLGTYQLVVTEARNGCKDTAYTTVNMIADSSDSRFGTLAVTFSDFSATVDKERKRNTLAWKLANVSDVEKFVVEKSANNRAFVAAGYVFPDNTKTNYSLNDAAAATATYYRIKAVSKSGAFAYTGIIKVKGLDAFSNRLSAYSDGSGSIVVNYTASAQQTALFSLLNINGQVVKKVARNVSAGSNIFRIRDLDNVPSGVYLVQVQSAGDVQTIKISL